MIMMIVSNFLESGTIVFLVYVKSEKCNQGRNPDDSDFIVYTDGDNNTN